MPRPAVSVRDMVGIDTGCVCILNFIFVVLSLVRTNLVARVGAQAGFAWC